MSERGGVPTTTTQQGGIVPAVAVAAPPPASSVGRILLINGAGLVVVVLIALGIFYIWHQGYYFYSTDDATVSGTIVSVAPSTAGTVTTVGHSLGDTIAPDSTLLTLRTATGATLPISSPAGGTIISLNTVPNMVVPAGGTLAQIVDLNRLTVTAYIEEGHIGDVRPGQGVDITVDAVANTTFHGHVLGVVPATASTFSAIPTTDYASGNFTKVTQRVPVAISLDNYAGHFVFPGASAAVTIHLHD